MSLKQEVIQAIQDNIMTERPTTNTVYFDGDVEEVLYNLGVDYDFKEGLFIVMKGLDVVEFECIEKDSRFIPDLKEQLILLS